MDAMEFLKNTVQLTARGDMLVTDTSTQLTAQGDDSNVQLTASDDVTIEGVLGAGSAHNGQVPRAEKWVFMIRNIQQGNTHSNYSKFAETQGLTSTLSSTGTFRDDSRQASAKMMRSVGAVIDDEHRGWVTKSCRTSFAFDGRDQVFSLRLKVVVAFPAVVVKEFVSAIVRDYGNSIEECALAAEKALKYVCWSQIGKRCATKPFSEPGAGDKFDEKAWANLRKTIFAGATDGCEVAVQAVQRLKTTGVTQNLRYQFRDRPHTTRTVMKIVQKTMQEGHPLMTLLLTGKDSFCKKARYSRAFQGIWVRAQKKKPKDFENSIERNATHVLHPHSLRQSK